MLEEERPPREDLKKAILQLIHNREKKVLPQEELFQYIVSENQIELEGNQFNLTYWIGFTESTFQGIAIKHKVARVSLSRQTQEKKQESIEEFNLDPDLEEYAVLLLDLSSVSTGVEVYLVVHEDLQKKGVGTTLFDTAEKVADDFLDQFAVNTTEYLEVQDFNSPNMWSAKIARKYNFTKAPNPRGSMMDEPFRKKIDRKKN